MTSSGPLRLRVTGSRCAGIKPEPVARLASNGLEVAECCSGGSLSGSMLRSSEQKSVATAIFDPAFKLCLQSCVA